MLAAPHARRRLAAVSAALPRALAAQPPRCGSHSTSTSSSHGASSSAATAPLSVAAAQIVATRDLNTNLANIIDRIHAAGRDGIHLLAFAEAATTGYYDDSIAATPAAALASAERKIAEACAEAGVATVVGTPHYENGRCFNSATVIDRTGQVVGRQHKLQLVPTDHWAVAGENMHVMWLPDIPLPLSVIICHDKRYPELVRLPVLCGARLIVYISWETWHDDGPVPRTDEELRPYRSQVVARAVVS